MPKIQKSTQVVPAPRSRKVPKLPVNLSINALEGLNSIAPSGRLASNSVVINGHEYELESLLAFLVSKVDHGA